MKIEKHIAGKAKIQALKVTAKNDGQFYLK